MFINISDWLLISGLGLIVIEFITIAILFHQFKKAQNLNQSLTHQLKLEQQARQFYAHQFKAIKNALRQEQQIHQITKNELKQAQQTRLPTQPEPTYSQLVADAVTPIAVTIVAEYISKHSGKFLKSAAGLLKLLWSPF